MTVKIAVCDDEKTVCDDICKRMKSIFRSKTIDCMIDCFSCGEQLCSEIRQTDFDLILLDIELPDMNGVDVGNFIREVMHNETVQIAFISSQSKYSMQLFEFRPLNFLIKPIQTETLFKLTEKFLLISGINAESFVFRSNREFKKIPLSDIMYFTSSGKKAVVVTPESSYEFYDTLSHVKEQLGCEQFFFIHKSFLVNYSYIKNYKYTEITMADGTVIPVSRSHQAAVRNVFLNMK